MSAALFPWVPEWLRIVVTLAMLAVCLIVGVALIRAAVMVFMTAAMGGQRLTIWLSEFLVNVVLGVVAMLGAGLLTLARACGWVARDLWARMRASALAPFAITIEAMRQRAELRRVWANEYRDQYPTFGAFLDAFARGGRPNADYRQEPRFDDAPRQEAPSDPPRPPPRPQPRPGPRPSPPPPAPPPDPKRQAFVAACRALGLPESGDFSREVLNRRFRLRIMAAHPDKGGSHEKAAALNAARDVIKHMKGWT